VQVALPFVLYKKVIILEQDIDGVRERALALFAGRARRTLGLPNDICILITSKDEVRELNRRYRQKNETTDVLSFASREPSFSGDIAITRAIAAANAAELGHSIEAELKVLILHGLLHLAGYDHENDHGEMEARELKLRQQFKLPLGLIERSHSPAKPTANSSAPASRHRRRKAVR
jgi:probable rRNA maturation factor